jgi:hypothetical protein
MPTRVDTESAGRLRGGEEVRPDLCSNIVYLQNAYGKLSDVQTADVRGRLLVHPYRGVSGRSRRRAARRKAGRSSCRCGRTRRPTRHIPCKTPCSASTSPSALSPGRPGSHPARVRGPARHVQRLNQRRDRSRARDDRGRCRRRGRIAQREARWPDEDGASRRRPNRTETSVEVHVQITTRP